MVETTEAIRIQLQFAADQAQKKAKAMERQLNSLENRFDPLSRATKRFDSGLKTLDANLASGNIDLSRYEKNLESLNREFDAAKIKAAGASTSVKALSVATGRGSAMRQYRNVIQQAGYQIGDFAVQVQGGQSAITAFSQQGSQMLGVFGAYGAIAGAALAITAPLVGSFMNGGEAAEEYADVVERLKEAIASYGGAAELASLSSEDLIEQYGRGAEALRPTLALLADIQKNTALSELSAAAAAFASEYSAAFAVLEDANAGYFDSFEIGGVEMARDEALQLRDAINAIGEADGPEQVSESARNLVDMLLAVYGSLENIPPAFQDVAEAAANADVNAAELQATIEESVFTVADLVSAAHQIDFSNAIAGAQTMLGVLQSAYATAAALAEQRVRNGGRTGSEMASLEGQYAQYGRGRQQFDTAASVARYAAPSAPSVSAATGRSGGGGGGGGSSSSASEASRELATAQREAQRVIEGLMSETQKYNAELEDLGDLYAKGVLTTDQFAQAQANLAEEFRNVQFADARSEVDSFTDALFEGEDAIKNYVKTAIAEFAKMQASGMFQSILGIGPASSGGSGGGILGSLFAGFFDKGGNIPSGQFGIAGENGPEIIRGPASVTSTRDTAKAMGGGGTIQNITIDARGAQEGVADQIVKAIREATPGIQAGAQRNTLKHMSETTVGWG